MKTKAVAAAVFSLVLLAVFLRRDAPSLRDRSAPRPESQPPASPEASGTQALSYYPPESTRIPVAGQTTPDQSPFHIQGSVLARCDRGPIAGVVVTAISGTAGEIRAETTTGLDGSFELSGECWEKLTLRCFPSPPFLSSETTVDVPVLEPLVVLLDATCRLTLHVVSASGRHRIEDVGSAEVAIFTEEDWPIDPIVPNLHSIRDRAEFDAVTDDRGMIIFTEVPCQQYVIVVEADGFIPSLFKRTIVPSKDAMGEYSTGSQSGVRLSPDCGAILGQVVDAYYRPMAYALICMDASSQYQTGPEKKTITLGYAGARPYVWSDASGNFELPLLCGYDQAQLLVCVNAPEEVPIAHYPLDAWPEERHVFVLPDCHKVRVTVTEKNGTALTGRLVVTGDGFSSYDARFLDIPGFHGASGVDEDQLLDNQVLYLPSGAHNAYVAGTAIPGLELFSIAVEPQEGEQFISHTLDR